MIGRRLAWLTTMALLTILVAVSAPAFPQEAAADAKPTEDDRQSAVETVLREQEQAKRGQRFMYEPEGRRDPFRSLFQSNRIEKASRPRGIAGMLVTELDLTGIVRDGRGGDVAMVTGSDNKGYFLRVGDRVYDGTVITIDSRLGAVTFRQKVDDPNMIKPYRDYAMRLVPLQESSDE